MPRYGGRKVDAGVTESSSLAMTLRPDRRMDNPYDDALIEVSGAILRQHATSLSNLRRTSGSSGSNNREDRRSPDNDVGSSARTRHPDIRLNTDPGSIAKTPIETSIWDWDVPFSSNINQASKSYAVKPQGELLQDHWDRTEPQHEFNLPYPVPGTGVDWPFSAGVPAANGVINSFTLRNSAPYSATSSTAGTKRKSTSERTAAGKQPDFKRASRIMTDTDMEMSPTDVRTPAPNTRSQAEASTPQGGAAAAAAAFENPEQTGGIVEGEARRSQIGASAGPRRGFPDTMIPTSLPPRKVFPIQIGDKLFRLSGASIASDAPSYFSHFFEEHIRQNEGSDKIRTLYIDRDPKTFEDIALHLQGYRVEPRDAEHFVRLFADAQFFSPQLFSSPIYIRIGNEEFQLPRDLFSNPGDTPNYFSVGFAVFFTTPNEINLGSSHSSNQRPPSILPPSIPNRSARTFRDLLHILKGYPVEIRSKEHRRELLRDARYFHLKGLEQRLIPHEISYNLARRAKEIVVRLQDIRQSGVSFVADNSPAEPPEPSPTLPSTANPTTAGPGWVKYQRPYVDAEAYSLIVDIDDDESTYLALAPLSVSSTARIGRAVFFNQTLARITSLFTVIANKMALPTMQPLGLQMLERAAAAGGGGGGAIGGAGSSGAAAATVSSAQTPTPLSTGISDEQVKVRLGPDADIVLDGKPWVLAGTLRPVSESSSGSSMDTGSGGGPGAGPGGSGGGGGGEGARVSTTTSARRGSKFRKRPPRTRAGPSGTDDNDDDDDEENEENDDEDDDENEDDEDEGEDWIVKRAQWRIRVQPVPGGAKPGRSGVEVILAAVKLEAYSDERGRNSRRAFLA